MAESFDRITDDEGVTFEKSTHRRGFEMDSLDEFVRGRCALHIERMDDDHIWIGVTSKGRHWAINLFVNGKKLHARVTDDGPVKLKTKRKKKAA